MGDDGDRADDGAAGLEARLASLEARVVELSGEVASLRSQRQAAAAHADLPPAVPAPRAVPAPAPPSAPVPPQPATPPAVSWSTLPALQGPPPPASGPPPLPAGWTAYVPQSKTPPPAGPAWQTAPPGPSPAAQAPASATGPNAWADDGDGAIGESDGAPPTWQPPEAWRLPELPSWSLADLEDRLTGRLLAWVGGVAVLLGAVLFLSLAFSRGWIGPSGRVAIGLVAGLVLFGVGAWLLVNRPRQGVVATVLVGVGIAVSSLAIFGATRLYELMPVELGLVGSLVLGVAAAALAIGTDSRVVGTFGLLAVLGSPPLLGASPGPVTIGLIATVLVGTTIVALQRSWRWFPGLAFALSGPQVASWLLGDAPVGLGLAAIAGFWLVHAIASGGEELLRPTDRLRDSSATLLVADAAFLVWAGFVVLDGPMESWRGTFMVGVALAHAVLALVCLVRQGDRHPFFLLVAGTGIGALTMAIPIQFGSPVVPIAWTAEATVLAWVAAERRHLPAGLTALLLGGLAVVHLSVVEYPIGAFGRDVVASVPFVDPAGMTLAFMLGALAVAGALLRDARIQLALAATALLLVSYALPFELSGIALLGAWSAIAVAAVAIERYVVIPGWPADVPVPRIEIDPGVPSGRVGLALVGAVPAALAVVHALSFDLPLIDLGRVVLPATPFTDPRAIAAAILVLASVAIGALLGRRGLRLGVIAATVVVAYALPFELSGTALLGAWSATAVAAVTIERSLGIPIGPLGLGLAGALPAALALGHALAIDLPLTEVGRAVLPTTPFTDPRAVAAAILVVASLAVGALTGRWGLRLGVLVAAIVVAYAVTFELPVAWVVMAWAGLATAAFVAVRVDPPSEPLALSFGAPVMTLAILIAVSVVARPDRLAVGDASIEQPIWDYLAFLAIVAGLAAAWRWGSLSSFGPWTLIAAGVLLVYVVSVAIVDAFAARIGGPTALEELSKQAQVALSVSWTMEGAALFGAALVRRVGTARQCGLALLALATGKVFLVDLAALDVAYRVLSLVGLGLLLLGCAYAYQRLRPDRVAHA